MRIETVYKKQRFYSKFNKNGLKTMPIINSNKAAFKKRFNFNYNIFFAFTLILILSSCAQMDQVVTDLSKQGINIPSLPGQGMESSGVPDNNVVKFMVDGVSSSISSLVTTDDEMSTLRNYSRTKKYIWSGVLSGILVGAGSNCIYNITKGGECLNNVGIAAAVGGGLGAAGGWYAASQQNKLENKSITLEQELNAVRLELEQAKLNREAAQRLVEKQIQELSTLRARNLQDKANKKTLEKQIETMEETNILLKKSIERMDSEIAAMEASLANEKNPTAKVELARVKSKMLEEKELLKKEIDAIETELLS